MVTGAVVGAPLLFALAHGERLQFAGLALLGVVLAVLVARTRRLVPSDRDPHLVQRCRHRGVDRPAGGPLMLSRLRQFWTPLRLVEAASVLAVIAVTVWELHPNLLFSSSLITGGDTGSHVALPAYLRSQGNLFNLTPWYPGWFAGMPAYTYYFVLPDFLATLASYVIGLAVAFKLATVIGSVLLPVAAYCMAELFRAPRPVPAALAIATLPFLFDASYTIDGGNLFSLNGGRVLVLALARAGPAHDRALRARRANGARLLVRGTRPQRDAGLAHPAVALHDRRGRGSRALRALAAPRDRRPPRRSSSPATTRARCASPSGRVCSRSPCQRGGC